MAAQNPAHEEEHSSFIKTPKQLAVVMILAFLLPVILIVMLAQLVYTATKTNTDQPAFTDEAVRARLQPVARVNLDVTGGGGGGTKAPRSGEEVYKAVCGACHASGAAGAPKFGDNAAWAPRLKEGYDHLVEAVIKGKGAMPARGGGADLSDYEIARAVAYLANNSGGSFKEPAPPAGAKPATAAAPAAAQRSGEEIVKATCGNCHQTGEGGAPKIGDKAAWSKRIANGVDSVVAAAIKGHGGMPARGGWADLTDAEMKQAVLYMFNAAGGKDAAPATTAAAAPAPAAPPAGGDAAKGKALYDQACMACHATGAAGAPKVGDKAAWAGRLGGGMDPLYASALQGKGAMPAKGGRADASDADVKAAVDYMVAASK